MTEKEFREIFASTKKIVLTAIMRYLPSQYSGSIDDVVQETYIRFMKSLDKKSFIDDKSRNNYLFTIAKNESLRSAQKHRREEIKAQKTIAADIVKETYDAELYNPVEEEVKKYISKLPDKYKDVLYLLVDGRSENEISEKLSIKKGTVKSRIHRARSMLKVLMKEDNYEFAG